MSFKDQLKKIPVIYPLAKAAKNGIRDMGTIPGFLAERKIKRGDGPIRVGFLCQYIPVWHKLQPIYEMMRADDRFEPFLVCIPSNIKDGMLTESDKHNDTLDYFREHGYPEALDALLEDGSWLDLKAMNLSFVFYPRPYDVHMPYCYQSKQVFRYSKICLILYGMNTTQEVVRITLNRSFFCHVYCYFAELPYSQEQNRKSGWLLHGLGLQKSVYYGMPGIEAICAGKDMPRPAWDFSKNSFRALWCPRWTTDLQLGGTNFFTYYQFLLKYAEDHPDTDMLFRPHPLALENFQKNGDMTAEEAECFVSKCEALPNVSLDKEKDYAATFWGTDVLISDISGIIPEYFVTGKPLIFCASNMILTPEKSTAKILEASYVVNNQAELQACLEQLKAGIDPLKEKRMQVVRELYSEELCSPAAKITEHLAKQ